MEFIMLCYPVREVMLWQWIGNPDCLVSHQVVAHSVTMDAFITRLMDGEAHPGCGWEKNYDKGAYLQSTAAMITRVLYV